MGYNTTVLILNDCLGEIEKNPEQFVKGIIRQMNVGGTFAVGHCGNPVDVKRTAHADVLRVYVSHGNWLSEMSEYATEEIDKAKQHEHVREALLSRCKRAKEEITRMEKALKAMDHSTQQENKK